MEKYKLPIFPTKGIIFLDTSIFGLDDYKKQYSISNHPHFIIKYIKAESSRLLNLKNSLLNFDNWSIIKEVQEEFIDGNKFFKYKIKYIKDRNTKSALTRLLKQREKILKLISQEHVIADNSLVPELEEIINQITPKVEKVFNSRNGKTNEKKTDIKLISLALAYARQDYSTIFSQDKILLKTFADCSRDLYLCPKTNIMSDRFETKIPTQAYNKALNKIKLKNPNTHLPKYRGNLLEQFPQP